MANHNIKPRWKKGESGNPAGKAVGTLNRSTIIGRWLEVADRAGLTEADKMVLAQVIKAKKGDTTAFKELFDGWKGKVADKSESKVEGSLEVKVKFGE